MWSKIRRSSASAFADPLGTAERLGAATQLISSLEYLARKADRGPGGLNDWTYLRDQFPSNSRVVTRLRDWIAQEPITQSIHASRVLAAIVLISPARNNYVRLACNAYLSASQNLTYPRHFFGTDGSDQVSFVIQTASAIGRAGATDASRRAAVQFIGAQTALSYGASGWAKLPGAAWQHGDALAKIMRTETYGDQWLFGQLRKYPAAARALCHLVLALECGFPLLLLKRGKYLDAGLLAMAGFHLANARFMGLSRFAWAFIATYPSVRALARGFDPAASTTGNRRKA
ncbi:hypothetical protein [Streptomyces sp. W007]|uniref:hypothetical protein n=1 Tax=Streptomyces sp. W007 TaxID=1055352 RepID=UPI0005167869|nr:hypothetical protein [Streptomyces sp. W007]